MDMVHTLLYMVKKELVNGEMENKYKKIDINDNIMMSE